MQLFKRQIEMNSGLSKTRIITGVTGFLGSHYVYRLLKGDSGRIFSLVRASSKTYGNERLLDAINLAAKGYKKPEIRRESPECITPILGDISEKYCGISDEDTRDLNDAGIDEVWHFAASLNFEESRREKIESMNLRGTENILSLVKQVNAKRLIYVSTAYSSGKMEGKIPEKIHSNETEFNNVYEETKCRAEKQVVTFCRENNILLTILRPSIVIGPNQTKGTGGSETGLYGFIREMVGLLNVTKAKDVVAPVGIRGDSKVNLNFIPIDQLVDDIFSIMNDDFGSQEIYHLSSNSNVNLDRFLHIVTKSVGLPDLHVIPYDSKSMSRVETNLDSRLEFYSGYFRFPKEFSRSLDRVWNVTEEDIFDFIRCAIAEHGAVKNA